MNRRSFLRRFSAAVAGLVVAPVLVREIIRAELPRATRSPFWIQETMIDRFTTPEYDAYMATLLRGNPFYRKFGDV